MTTAGDSRGGELLAGGARFEREPGLLARLIAPGFHKVLDKVDEGLEQGSIIGRLPDGTTRILGGRNPGFEVEVTLHDWRGLMRLATNGSVGWYQAWEAGEWESPDPVSVFALFSVNGTALGDTGRAKGPFRWFARLAHWSNRNTHSGAERNIHAHYDLGNDFYAQWLDPSMSYSSAMFGPGDNLEQAQHRKWHRLAQRLGSPETILEIGCGWGSLADYLAGRGAKVTGISLSEEQLAWARERHDKTIDFRKQDYRDVDEKFAAIVSVEMVEAVGREYWPSYFDCIAGSLQSGGRAAIQYISMEEPLFEAYAASADFIQAYIFPGGLLIKTSEFQKLAKERGLRWEDQQDFGMDYARTLQIWRENFDAALAQGRLPAGFDEKFARLWRFYLMYCEGGFRGGSIDVHQVTLIKE